MRLRVDPVKCQGYAICTEIAARHFTLDDWGFAQALVVDVTEADVEAVSEAIADCPVRAIRWIAGPGDGGGTADAAAGSAAPPSPAD
ncbi:ferredoxin [Pseudonocardia acidicola]|uniref:Ferredoxin n=1 Tax=Pseudonocardia acidicola TaxID=2724939 RepID=A0ABX1SA15_9PSEU|nr:ferredoxin [Pseudonocardia acidicola]NMH97308.1 ferredoxin [Pseudonocardia acidicola]